MSAAIVWFRQDLRLADNPALRRAVQHGGPIVPVFIWAPEEQGKWAPGAASRWWLHQSLRALDQSLARLGSRLVIRRGNSLEQLRQVAQATAAAAVFFNRQYEPHLVQRDREVTGRLLESGLKVEEFPCHLLFEPWAVANSSGKPFQVFTPFWRHCLGKTSVAEPLSAPRAVKSPPRWPESVPLDALELEPKIDWAAGLRQTWTPGEAGGQQRLNSFVRTGLLEYEEKRDLPAEEGTSRLSPHLHFGEVSPRQVWHAVKAAAKAHAIDAAVWTRWQFLAELGWREFGYHLLYHFPHTPTDSLRPEFSKLRWRRNERWLKAWQKGCTGYPIIDAGMRQLWKTGWMHNRVRMIVGSFLVKDLLLRWQEGERWFWDTLVDADLANNTLGWQWVAGCGADAMPYFRIFNPVSQAERYDPLGTYVRQWVPELGALSPKWIHQPWEAPPEVLAKAGIEMGVTYPERLINHALAREVALEAYESVKAKPATRVV